MIFSKLKYKNYFECKVPVTFILPDVKVFKCFDKLFYFLKSEFFAFDIVPWNRKFAAKIFLTNK